jgi:hypoxanthine phosphoribosyltransferase/phosphoribosylanthranilate isomerase
LKYWKSYTTEEKLLILCIVDHYKNALLSALNTLSLTSIKTPGSISKGLFYNLDKIVINITTLYYQLIFDAPKTILLEQLLADQSISTIIIIMKRYQYNQQGMRELDDPYIICLSVLSLLKQIEEKNYYPDVLIDFSYGGIELGPAYLAIFKLFYKEKQPPKLIHCFYSTRKNLRENIVITNKYNKRWLFDFMPNYYNQKLNNALLTGQRILLYDNNATTFSTLAEVKNYFGRSFNKKVEAVVAAVNYNNISRYLRKEKNVEPLHPHWNNTLDYKPVYQYITAFSTWGTSKKGKILESIFFLKKPINMPNRAILFPNTNQPVFKVCRVHNLHDLNLALKNGANMIGVHAVYTDREKYKLSEKFYRPFYVKDVYSHHLPISIYECTCIKAMQNYIPKNLKQALIFENETSLIIIKKSIHAYGMNPKNIFIQLHHRTNKKYIEIIKQGITENIIAVIGAFQGDFTDYYNLLEVILNPETDYILIDLSKHQPDILTQGSSYPALHKITLLKKLAPILSNNNIPILLADDVSIDTMKHYLKTIKNYPINLAGIDMQNNLELDPKIQRYCMVNDQNNLYQMKIRKSNEYLHKWGKFILSNEFKNLLIK